MCTSLRLEKLFEQAGQATILIPSSEDVKNVAVGSTELSPFGRPAKVTEVYARGIDDNGKPYVCFYVSMGDHASVSQSYKAGELVRTLSICSRLNSQECHELERLMNEEFGPY